MTQADTLLDRLQTAINDLDRYVETRAEAIAAPRIRAAQEEASAARRYANERVQALQEEFSRSHKAAARIHAREIAALQDLVHAMTQRPVSDLSFTERKTLTEAVAARRSRRAERDQAADVRPADGGQR